MGQDGHTAGFDICGVVTSDKHAIQSTADSMVRSLVRSGRTSPQALHLDGAVAKISLASTTSARHQPESSTSGFFRSSDGGSAIVLAGNITNAADLQSSISAIPGTTRSDQVCQAILYSYLRYGPRNVARLQGSFAIAIWDGNRNQLYLARDRVGLKPLYYWSDGGTFLFSTKVKSLLDSGVVPRRPSPAGTYSYLLYGVVCEPFTAVDSVFSLPPAHFAIVKDGQVDIQRYWDIFASRPPMQEDIDGAAGTLRSVLEDSVFRNFESCGEQTVLLSGGMDSSSLAALTKHMTGEVSTLSIDPVGLMPSDKPYIDLVAGHLESRHSERSLTVDDTSDMLDDYFDAMDQPTVDGLNAYVAARHAGEVGFSSALYGVGSDELFGPPWNLASITNMERFARYPAALAVPAGVILGSFRGKSHGPFLKEWMSREAKPGAAFDFLTRQFFQREMDRLWTGPSLAKDQLGDLLIEDLDYYARMYSQLTVHYFLKNQLLRIADWAATHHAVDIRMPFLDQPVVEHALSLPPELKVGQHKRVLAAAVADVVPAEVLTRPKLGFGIPLPLWMHSGLKDQVNRSIHDTPAVIKDVVASSEVNKVWAAYLKSGVRWRCSWALFTLNEWWRSTE